MFLGEALASDRSRNLDLLRLVLAASVIIMPGPWRSAPAHRNRWTGLPAIPSVAGRLVSSFRIAGYCQRTAEHPAPVPGSRARRIMPGVGVVVLVTLAWPVCGSSNSGSSDPFARVLTRCPTNIA